MGIKNVKKKFLKRAFRSVNSALNDGGEQPEKMLCLSRCQSKPSRGNKATRIIT